MSKNTKVTSDIESLKERVDNSDMDKKLKDCQVRYNNAMLSVENSTKNIELSEEIIKNIKKLDKIIDTCNTGNTSITALKGSANSLKDKIGKEIDDIGNEKTLEENVRNLIINRLKAEETNVKGIMSSLSLLSENINQELEASKDLKGIIRDDTTIEHRKGGNLKNISLKESNIKNIIEKINIAELSIQLSNIEVDNTLNIKNDEISNAVHNLITKLYEKINGDVKRNLYYIKEIERNIESYNFESYINKVNEEYFKLLLRMISTSISNDMSNVQIQKSKIIEIRENSRKEYEESNNKKKNSKNSNEKKKNFKEIYDKMEKMSEELNEEIKKLELLLINIKKTKLGNKKALLQYDVDQIVDLKEKVKEEIQAIDECNTRIMTLKEEITKPQHTELSGFNCENYISKAKESQNKINQLTKNIYTLKGEAYSSTSENKIDGIKLEIEQMLKDVIEERNSINNALNEIKGIEEILKLKEVKSIMDKVKYTSEKSKEEEENVKEQFRKLEQKKEEITADILRAEKLRDSLIKSVDGESIDMDIKEIRKINVSVIHNIESIIEILKIDEQHNGICNLHHNNTERGKSIIEYLKSHDTAKKDEIQESQIEELKRYESVSKNSSSEAGKSIIEARKYNEWSRENKKKINDILSISLISVEKIKLEIMKKEISEIVQKIKDDYKNIPILSEKLVGKLNKLKEDASIKELDGEETNNKSLDAFGKIQITKRNVQNILDKVERLKQRALNILNDSEGSLKSLPEVNETEGTDFHSEIKAAKDNIENTLEVLKNMESNKSFLSLESYNLQDIETTIGNIENEMEISKKHYEEGILEEIKKIADREKEDIELLKKSINIIIENAVYSLKEFELEENNIVEKFNGTIIELNKILDIFDRSYKNIEALVLDISESTVTHESLKEKREKALVEKENLKKQNGEMKKLLNSTNDIKRNETLKLILYMKGELDKANKKAEAEYSKVNINIEGMKVDVENIKSSDSASSALNNLSNIENKNNEVRQYKIIYSSYKDKIDLFNSNIDKAAKFIGMNIEEISKLNEYESIKNNEGIVLKIQGNMDDIIKKVSESKNVLETANTIYEEIKLKDELKKRIKEEIKKVDDIFVMIESSIEKYGKIDDIKFDHENYDEIFKIGKDYESIKHFSSTYMMKLNEMDRELKIHIIKTELEDYKSTLNDLKQLVDVTKINESSRNTLEETKINIDKIIKEVDDRYSNVLEIDRSFDELLELKKMYMLSLQSVVISNVHVKILKDVIIIHKNQKDVVLCVDYIKNTYDSISNDIYASNENYSRNTISNYESNNVKNANKFLEEFKKKEQEAIATSNTMQKLFLSVEESKDENKIYQYLQELKGMYEKFQKEKISINEIFRNINGIRLREMKEVAEKFVEIVESYKVFAEVQKEKFIGSKNKLEEIEDLLINKEGTIRHIEHEDLEYSKKVDEICRDIMNQSSKISELENVNSTENTKMTTYEEKISYLMRRITFLLNDVDLYKNKSDYNLLEEINGNISGEENNYIKKVKDKGNESKTVLHHIKISIERNKDLFIENNNTLLWIHNIIRSINVIKENDRTEAVEREQKKQIRNHIDKITKKGENISMNNGIDKNSQNVKGNKKFNEDINNKEVESDTVNIKLKGIILSGLLICGCVIIIILYKRGNEEKKVDEDEACEKYDADNDLFNNYDHDEAIDVSPAEYK